MKNDVIRGGCDTMVFDAEKYAKNNLLQQNDAEFILQKYLHQVKWADGDSIFDVGTGDGKVFAKVLLPKIPTRLGDVVISDISQEMLKKARETFQNKNIKFLLLNIGVSIIPPNLQEEFNHIFSFYCLQWVPNQRQAFENLFSMLKPGGDILVSIVKDHVIIPPLRQMARKLKTPTTENKMKYFPYYKCTNTLLILNNLLSDIGFEVKEIEILKRCYIHQNSAAYWDWVTAVTPLIKELSSQELKTYKKDMFHLLQTSPWIRYENSKDFSGKVYDNYEVIVVSARKPDKGSI